MNWESENMNLNRYEGNGRMSKAVVHNDTIYLCGQTVGSDDMDVKEQTKVILERIEDLLQKYGSDKKHILSALIHLKEISFFDDMNSVWDAWVEKGHEPARTCIEALMCRENILVEITVVAAVKK